MSFSLEQIQVAVDASGKGPRYGDEFWEANGLEIAKALLVLIKPTPNFLSELLERAKRYGWNGDYVEIAKFVEDLHKEEGIKLTPKQLEPYPG